VFYALAVTYDDTHCKPLPDVFVTLLSPSCRYAISICKGMYVKADSVFNTVQHRGYSKRNCLLGVSVLWSVVRCILVALGNVASNGRPIVRSEMKRL